jgi:hypothetical protein
MEVVLAQLGPAHLFAPSQHVAAPTGGHKALGQHGLELDLGFLPADEVQAKVRIALRHGHQHLVGAGVVHLHADLRKALVVALDHLR